jgi:aldose 1-epimerase
MKKNDYSQIEAAIITKSFGFLPDGKEVFLYELCNKNGVELSVINYGATITSIKIPTSNHTKIDAVLGFENIEDYINAFDLPNAPYFGTVVGRYAGRINNAAFQLNGKNINLTKNHNTHQIHGGKIGFSRKFWEVKSMSQDENPSITLACVSENNEENYPGELTINVTYTLTENNEVKVDFSAKTTEDTIINLTQHTYFNLEGHISNISNQKLSVCASKILETNDALIPTGNFISLKNHYLDFSKPENCPESIDTTFVIDDIQGAILSSKKTNLKLTVITNQPAIHIYIGGNCFDQIQGKENAKYHPTSGICFETQNFPDAPNHSHFPNSILKKGMTYNHNTTFKFENLKQES